MIRIAHGSIEMEYYFVSEHNIGRLVDERAWQEFNEAKQAFIGAMNKFEHHYHDEMNPRNRKHGKSSENSSEASEPPAGSKADEG